MYESYFGLNEKPFSITPDPRYLYLSERHSEALAHLLYGITESGGFIQLTGEVGTGKTTLVRSVLEQLPDNVDIALVLNPRLSPNEFLEAICQELHVEVPRKASARELVDALNTHLLKAHARDRRVVLIVDEAQNLSVEVLEQVRLLTNLETAKRKLLQIILIGQPELRSLLGRTDLRQLAQRITGRYHLNPLSREESAAYLRHRLEIAGATTDVFRPAAVREIHRLANGVPRLMNVIADRSLLGAYSREQHTVTPKIVREAAAEVFGHIYRPSWLGWAAVVTTIAGIGLVGLGVAEGLRMLRSEPPAGAVPTATAPATTIENVDNVQPQQFSSAVSAEPATVEPSPEPGPAVAATADLLDRHEDVTGTDDAFAELFALWGVEYAAEEGLACEQAAAMGLRCLFQQGALGSLLRLNRPVILSLRDSTGSAHQVVLASLAGERARLRLAGEQYVVSVGDLTRYWDGDFLLLWRPQGAAPILSLGMRGEEVVRLRRSLEAIDGALPASGNPALFDETLAERVRSFQRARQLEADGIVGARTQIVMSTELGAPDTPYLLEGG